jgi:hypothetical protein
MLKAPRLDAAGVLHHIMSRGIKGSEIFRTDQDRGDILNRMAELSMSGDLMVYA